MLIMSPDGTVIFCVNLARVSWIGHVCIMQILSHNLSHRGMRGSTVDDLSRQIMACPTCASLSLVMIFRRSLPYMVTRGRAKAQGVPAGRVVESLGRRFSPPPHNYGKRLEV